MPSDYRDLRVWQEAMEIVHGIYRATQDFPKQETFGLAAQMRRAAVSIPSNIAEGKGRNSQRDLARFLYQSRGSLLELETQILIAQDLGYVDEEVCKQLTYKVRFLARTLNALINRVQEAFLKTS